MTNETSAGIVVYFQKPLKYLLLHYGEGHWDFPKGHVEIGERHEQAAMRETKEETGLIVNVNPEFKEMVSYSFKGKYNELINKKVYFYVGEALSKDVVISNEHVGYVWMSYENALKRLTYENAREILKKANEFLMDRTK